jgi:hypothetical protein
VRKRATHTLPVTFAVGCGEEAGAWECESRKWRGDRRSMKKVESRLSPFSILLLYFLTAGAVRK